MCVIIIVIVLVIFSIFIAVTIVMVMVISNIGLAIYITSNFWFLVTSLIQTTSIDSNPVPSF